MRQKAGNAGAGPGPPGPADGLYAPAAKEVAEVIVAFVSVRFARDSQDVCANVVTGESAAISNASQMHGVIRNSTGFSLTKNLSPE
jgi:hypothetical protein